MKDWFAFFGITPPELDLTRGETVGILIFVLWVSNSIKILRQYECGVIFRGGKVLPSPKGPGLILVLWPIDKMVKVDLRIVTLDALVELLDERGVVPKQEVLARIKKLGEEARVVGGSQL